MNSQQELLEAINTISQNKDRSFDTPATVLRVEGDTVWVHIDGGADETPVNKTISCAEGETVQVRISNGSAFLVGNASAPPTDDKTANVAHFVAEQADVKATSAEEKAVEAIRSVEAIEQTVEEKVSIGDSNIEVLSSTMYQNANGVNIYNDELAVGDSYAHIDGDSFDIKICTTAGQIDDVNDGMYASFGREVTVGSRLAGSTVGRYSQVFGVNCEASQYNSHAEGYSTTASGSSSHAEGDYTTASGYYSHTEGQKATASGLSSHAEGYSTTASGHYSHAQNQHTLAQSYNQTAMGRYNIADANDKYALIIGNGTADDARSDALRVKWNGDILAGGTLKNLSGVSLLDEWTPTATVSGGSITFSNLDDSLDYSRPFFENELYNVTAMTKSGSGTSTSLTFTTDAPDNTVGKLRIIR